MDSDSESDFETHFQKHKNKFVEEFKKDAAKAAVETEALCEPIIAETKVLREAETSCDYENVDLVSRLEILEQTLRGTLNNAETSWKNHVAEKTEVNIEACSAVAAQTAVASLERPARPLRQCKRKRCSKRIRNQRIDIDQCNMQSEFVKKSVFVDRNDSNIEDDLVIINVLWRSIELNKFKVGKLQKLKCISEYYSKKVAKDPKLLLFTLNDQEISMKDNCYVSLSLDDSKTIEAGLLPDSYLNRKLNSIGTIPITEGTRYKIQCANRKLEPFHVYVKENEKMNQVFWQISQRLDVPSEQIELYFDGDAINSNQTTLQIGLEPDDCLDLQF